MGIKWQLLYRFHVQYRIRLVLRFSKWGLPFFIFKIDGDIESKICTNFNLFNKSKLSLYQLYLRQLLKHKNGRPLYEKLVRRTASFLYFLCHALNIRNQRRLSSRLSIPVFIGTPCSYKVTQVYAHNDCINSTGLRGNV